MKRFIQILFGGNGYNIVLNEFNQEMMYIETSSLMLSEIAMKLGGKFNSDNFRRKNIRRSIEKRDLLLKLISYRQKLTNIIHIK